MKIMFLVLLLVVLLSTGCDSIISLSNETGESDNRVVDTLQIVYTFNDTVPSYQWTAENGDVSYFAEQPDVIDTSYVSYKYSYCSSNMFTKVIWKWHQIDTLKISIHENATDTLFIDSVVIENTVYDTIPVPLAPGQQVDEFLQQHPPRFKEKETLVQTLDTVKEGYIFYLPLDAEQIRFDSATYRVIDMPDFMKPIVGNCRETAGRYYTDRRDSLMVVWSSVMCYSYKESVSLSCAPIAVTSIENSNAGLDDLGDVYMVKPDSTHVGREHIFKAVVENYLGAADTLEVKIYVAPFDWAAEFSDVQE